MRRTVHQLTLRTLSAVHSATASARSRALTKSKRGALQLHYGPLTNEAGPHQALWPPHAVMHNRRGVSFSMCFCLLFVVQGRGRGGGGAFFVVVRPQPPEQPGL
jgi:hypothetical protein